MERERKKMTVSPERKEIFDLSMQSLEKKFRKSIDHRFLNSIIYSLLSLIFHIKKKARILKNILREKFIVSTTVSKGFPESAFRSCKLGTIRGQTLRGNSEGVTKTFQQFSEWQNENCRQRGRKQSVLRSTKVRDNNGGERGEPSS